MQTQYSKPPRRLLVGTEYEAALRAVTPSSESLRSTLRLIRNGITEWNTHYVRCQGSETFQQALQDVVDHSVRSLPRSVTLCDLLLWAWVLFSSTKDRLQLVLETLSATLAKGVIKYDKSISPFCILNIVARRQKFPSLNDVAVHRVSATSDYDKITGKVPEVPIPDGELIALLLQSEELRVETSVLFACNFLTARNQDGLFSAWIFDLLTAGSRPEIPSSSVNFSNHRFETATLYNYVAAGRPKPQIERKRPSKAVESTSRSETRRWRFQDVKVHKGFSLSPGCPFARREYFHRMVSLINRKRDHPKSRQEKPHLDVPPAGHVQQDHLMEQDLPSDVSEDEDSLCGHHSDSSGLQSELDEDYRPYRRSMRRHKVKPNPRSDSGEDVSMHDFIEKPQPSRKRRVPEPDTGNSSGDFTTISCEARLEGFGQALRYIMTMYDVKADLTSEAGVAAILNGERGPPSPVDQSNSKDGDIKTKDISFIQEKPIGEPGPLVLIAQHLIPFLPVLWERKESWSYMPLCGHEQGYALVLQVLLRPVLQEHTVNKLFYTRLVQNVMKCLESFYSLEERSPYLRALLMATAKHAWHHPAASGLCWSMIIGHSRPARVLENVVSELFTDARIFKELFYPPHQITVQKSLDFLTDVNCSLGNFLPTIFMWVQYFHSHEERSGAQFLVSLLEKVSLKEVRITGNKHHTHTILLPLLCAMSSLSLENQVVISSWCKAWTKERSAELSSIRKLWKQLPLIEMRGFWYVTPSKSKKGCEVARAYRQLGVILFALMFKSSCEAADALIRFMVETFHEVGTSMKEPDVTEILRDLFRENVERCKNVIDDVNEKVWLMSQAALQVRLKEQKSGTQSEADYLLSYTTRRVIELLRILDLEGIDLKVTKEEGDVFRADDTPAREIKSMVKTIITDTHGGKIDRWGRYMDYAMWTKMASEFLGSLNGLLRHPTHKSQIIRIFLNTATLFNFIQLEKYTTTLSESAAKESLSIFKEVLQYLSTHPEDLKRTLLSRGIFKWLLSIVVEGVPKNPSRKRLDYQTASGFLKLVATVATAEESQLSKFTSIGNDMVRLVMFTVDRAYDPYYETLFPRKQFTPARTGPISSIAKHGSHASMESLDAKAFLVDFLVIENSLHLMRVHSEFRRTMSKRIILDTYRRLGLPAYMFEVEPDQDGEDIVFFEEQRPEMIHLVSRLLDIWDDLDPQVIDAVKALIQGVVEGFLGRIPGATGRWLFDAQAERSLAPSPEGSDVVVVNGGHVGSDISIHYRHAVLLWNIPTTVGMYLTFFERYLAWVARSSKYRSCCDSAFSFSRFIRQAVKETSRHDSGRKWELVGADDQFYDPPDLYTIEDENMKTTWEPVPSPVSAALVRPVQHRRHLGIAFVEHWTQTVRERIERQQDVALLPLVNRVTVALKNADEALSQSICT